MLKNKSHTLKKKIIIVCPRCKKTMTVDRQEDDPQEASKAFIVCPECSDGLFTTTRYVDKKGRTVYVER